MHIEAGGSHLDRDVVSGDVRLGTVAHPERIEGRIRVRGEGVGGEHGVTLPAAPRQPRGVAARPSRNPTWWPTRRRSIGWIGTRLHEAGASSAGA
ncbi:MAG TPA: hypothetical protein VHT75_12305 [Acidimicrobiales bacterium]|nr:hypothetical protein [Acidimicrobiales bacterium]